MADEAELSPYLRRLPIGKRLPIDPVLGSELFPFEGDVLVRPLEPPIIPEPKRRGQPGAEPCWSCSNPDERVVWRNARWNVRVTSDEPPGLPTLVVLEPRAHHDLEDLPDDITAELGPMIQRLARAISALPDVGRVHVNRWGDGSEHFHIWFLARPKGMWQMRGAMLAVWDDLLPRVPAEEWTANLRAVAQALAREDGSILI